MRWITHKPSFCVEGDAQAMKHIASSRREVFRAGREGLAGTNTYAAAYLIAARCMDTLREMTSCKDNKVVYVPCEAIGVLGALGSMKSISEEMPKPTGGSLPHVS